MASLSLYSEAPSEDVESRVSGGFDSEEGLESGLD